MEAASGLLAAPPDELVLVPPVFPPDGLLPLEPLDEPPLELPPDEPPDELLPPELLDEPPLEDPPDELLPLDPPDVLSPDEPPEELPDESLPPELPDELPLGEPGLFLSLPPDELLPLEEAFPPPLDELLVPLFDAPEEDAAFAVAALEFAKESGIGAVWVRPTVGVGI